MRFDDPIALHSPSRAAPLEIGVLDKLEKALSGNPEIHFAALVGSRAEGRANESSDWDIAVLWKQTDALLRISRHEYLRRELASVIGIAEEKVDLIDLSNAGLAMRALVAEEGFLLAANNERSWTKFLERTWRELEDFYWEKEHFERPARFKSCAD